MGGRETCYRQGQVERGGEPWTQKAGSLEQHLGTSTRLQAPSRKDPVSVVHQVNVEAFLGVNMATPKCPSWCVWNQDPDPSLLWLIL